MEKKKHETETKKTHEKKHKKSELEELKEKLEQKEKEAMEYKDLLQRLKADFDNFKKKTEQEKCLLIEYGKEIILESLININNSLEKAIAGEHKEEKPIKEGIELIMKDIQKIFEKNNLTRIETREKTFDPNFHEAIFTEKREDKEEGEIISEYSPGYLKNDKLFLPSKVVVAKK